MRTPSRAAAIDRHEERERAARARASTSSVGQRSGLANQNRLSLPAIEHTAIAIGAARVASAVSQSMAGHPPRPVPRPLGARRRQEHRDAQADHTDEAEDRGNGAGLAHERDERAAQREQRPDTEPAGDVVTRARTTACEATRVHRLGERDRAFHPELEHRHELAEQPSAAHDGSAGARRGRLHARRRSR